MPSLFNLAVKAVSDRLPVGSPQKQALTDIVLQHLGEVAYARLKAHGFEPGTIIDVGAFMGNWTKLVKVIFPHAPVIMIEAQEEMENQLRTVASHYHDVKHHIALIGATEEKNVPFHIGGTGSSMYRERSNATMVIATRPMTTLDKVLNVSGQTPIFLKLDVQGTEIDVLRGASETLRATEVLQLETALLPYNEGAPTS